MLVVACCFDTIFVAGMSVAEPKYLFPGRAVASFFFEAIAGDNGGSSWKCKKCGTEKQSQKGYTNLRSHTVACVGKNYESQLQDHLKKIGCYVDKKGNILSQVSRPAKGSIQQAINSFVTSNVNELRAFTWIRWLSCRNMPLSEIENDLTKDLAKAWRPFSAKTIRKYILATSNLVAQSIAKELQEAGLVSLILDGWTADGASFHYIAIFAGYKHPETCEYTEVLLAMQPTLDEDGAMDADAHAELLDSTIELYGLSKQANVLCLVGDNCNTNKCLARPWGVPLVGCASHRFNLAVKYWMENQPGLLDVVKKLSVLMGKACNLKAAHSLRDLTLQNHGKELRAQQMNETHWTSIFTMAQRYLQIKGQIESIIALFPYTLDLTENQLLKDAVVHFEVFQMITVEIQAKGMDLVHCRKQFDTLLEEDCYKVMSKYLAADAKIIDFRHFESGVRKIMAGEPLSCLEAEACIKLRKRDVNDSDSSSGEEEDEVTMTVFEKLKMNSKRRKVSITVQKEATRGYLDVGKIVCATSNCCERLFSEAKYIMLPHRRGMSPILFEALLYLKKNLNYWNVSTVAKAMKMKEEDIQEQMDRDDDGFYEDV